MKDNIFDKLKKIKTDLQNKCTICNHTGKVDGKDCACVIKFDFYVEMCVSGIPREFWDLTVDNWQGDRVVFSLISSYIKNIDSAYDKGYGFILSGGSGVGKDLLIIYILKEAIRKKYSVKVISMSELVDFIIRMRDKQSYEEYDMKIKTTDFLLISSLGLEYRPNSLGVMILSKFITLIKFRKSNLLPTFITTSLTKKDFNSIYSSILSDLFLERNFVTVSGDNYRENNNDPFGFNL